MIEVIIDKDSETKECYHFNVFDLNVVFVYYRVVSKPKGKKTWKVLYYWDKYNERDCNPEPELSNEVRQLALTQTQTLIKVQTWKEWKTK